MNPQLPRTKETIDLEWDWPSWKFRLPYEALFTTLHDRFNTRTCAIQDPTAFHYDVRDCGETSLCREEFYAKLTERREQRIRELEEVWRETSTLLGANPSTWDCPRCGEAKKGEDSRNDGTAERWAAFCQLTRTMSFDSLVRFFDGYVRDEREREAEKSLSIKKMEEKWPIERAMSHDPSCADQTASPPSEAACLPISPKSSHDETAMARKIGDPDADADRKQSKSCLPSPIPDTPPTHGDIISPLSASALHVGPTCQKSTSPARPTRKRRSDTEEPRDEEEYAHNRGKRRRIVQDASRVCAGVEEASPSRAVSPREKTWTSQLGVSGPTSPSPDCVSGTAKHHISRTSTSRPPTPKTVLMSSIEHTENIIRSELTSGSTQNPSNRRDKK